MMTLNQTMVTLSKYFHWVTYIENFGINETQSIRTNSLGIKNSFKIIKPFFSSLSIFSSIIDWRQTNISNEYFYCAIHFLKCFKSKPLYQTMVTLCKSFRWPTYIEAFVLNERHALRTVSLWRKNFVQEKQSNSGICLVQSCGYI